jgi:signal peptidase I
VTKKSFLFFSGRSMIGTFREGDWLEIEKCETKEIRTGNVVVFMNAKAADRKTHCVHRVVSLATKCLITRGDNNPQNDEEPLTEKSLIGKVTHYERNGKIHKVWNGRLGLMRARALHSRLHIISASKLLLRKPYRWLKRSGIIARMWRPEIEIIRLQTAAGPLIKYIHKGKTVASYWVDGNCWQFRRPYDFIIRPRLNSGKQS